MEEVEVMTLNVAITIVEEEEKEGMIEFLFLIILKNQIRDNPQDGIEEAIRVKEEE